MNIKFCIVTVCIFTLIVQSIERKIEQIFPHSTDQYQELVHVLVTIFEKCVNEKPRHNVIIGSWTEKEAYFLNKLTSNVPVHLMKSNENATLDKYIKSIVLNATVRALEVPANNFVIVASTKKKLLASLRTLKISYWWNHNGHFLLVNENAKNGCENAASLLYELWTFNILSAIFLCHNLKHKVELYTFNPYNQFAPKFWKVVGVDRRFSDNHPWTLFKQSWEISSFYSRKKFCKSLIFEKTSKLNNYPLQLAAYVQSNLLQFDGAKEGWSRFGGVNSDITSTICKHLNASVNFTFYDRMGSLDDDGAFQGFFKDLRSGTVDFAMNMNLQRFYWKFQTYPHETSGFCIVTLKYPNNFFYKFQVVFTVKWWLVLGFVFLVTMLTLKFLLGETLSFAALEFLRMLLNVSTVKNPPRDTFRRFAFLQAVLLTLLLNVFFQSRLSSMFVVPKTRPLVDSLEELESSDLTIYGTLQYNELLSDVQALVKRYRISNYSECVERLNNSERVVCLPGCIEARYSIYDSDKYHVSKNAVRTFYMVFSTRVDWPLLNRFNKIISLMGEAGLINLFRTWEAKYFKQNIELDEPKQLDINNLKFGFEILFFGIALALCILFIEIGAHDVKMRIKRTI